MAKIISLEYNGELGYAATIEDVVLFVFKIFEISPEQFLDFKNGDLSNRELIFLHYQIGEKIKYNLADDKGNVTKTFADVTAQMRCPYITLFIDSKYVTKDVILNNSSLLVDDFAAQEFDEEATKNGESQDGTKFMTNKFFFEQIKIIPKITKNNPLDSINSDDKKTTRKQYLNPRVWIWCKSLNENGEFNNNSIFDLTPFLKNVEFSNSETGGQFSLGLLNIEGFINVIDNIVADGIWNPRKDRYVKFNQDNKINYLFKNILNARYNANTDNLFTNNYLQNQNSFSDIEERKIKQKMSESNQYIEDSTVNVIKTLNKDNKSISSDLFFKNLISENDVVFITFRDDEDNNIETVDDFFISNDKLPGMSWEMIGLVDRNSVGITYEGTEHNVTVSGRDMMKLLIEDGSYFFANSFSDDDTKSIFQNIDLPNRGDGVNSSNKVIEKGAKGANRLVMSGMIDMLFTAEARNVHFVMNLLMSTLSNIEICPSRLFEYQQNKTKFQIPKFETIKK
jgi:hypothetical protein